MVNPQFHYCPQNFPGFETNPWSICRFQSHGLNLLNNSHGKYLYKRKESTSTHFGLECFYHGITAPWTMINPYKPHYYCPFVWLCQKTGYPHSLRSFLDAPIVSHYLHQCWGKTYNGVEDLEWTKNRNKQLHTCVYICIHIYIYTCIYIYIYMYIYICINIYMYKYIYIYTYIRYHPPMYLPILIFYRYLQCFEIHLNNISMHHVFTNMDMDLS